MATARTGRSGRSGNPKQRSKSASQRGRATSPKPPQPTWSREGKGHRSTDDATNPEDEIDLTVDEAEDKTDDDADKTEDQTDDDADKTDDDDKTDEAEDKTDDDAEDDDKTDEAEDKTDDDAEEAEEPQPTVEGHRDLLTHEPLRNRSNGGQPAAVALPVGEEPQTVAPVATEALEPKAALAAPDRGDWVGSDAEWPALPARRIVAALAIVLLTGALGYVIGSQAPPTYGAEAEVLYRLDSSLSEGQIDHQMNTQVALAQSQAVLRPVATAENLTITELRDHVSVAATGESGILLFTAKDKEQADAMRIVGEHADAYLVAANNTESSSSVDYLQARIADAEDERDTIAALLDAGGSTAVSERELEIQLESVLSQLSDLQRQLTEAELGLIEGEAAVILSVPALLDDPVGSPELVAGGLGALAGIAIAALFLLLLRQRDKRIGRES